MTMKFFLTSILVFITILHGFGQKKNRIPDTDVFVTPSTASSDSIQSMLDDYERVQLPPLSVFLESIYEHPSIRKYEAKRDEVNADLKQKKSEWLNYIRVSGLYQYGSVISLTSSSASNIEQYFTSSGRNQHTYNGGVSVAIPIGDLVGQKQKVRAQKARLRQVDYEYEETLEERKLKILDAYNLVLQELATLKAKSDAAALYNAQMKISEQDFINGKIDIISLSLERGRRSTAVVNYQEGRAALHNAITLLEMLTNVKIINR